jgi:hypothetical protein
MTTLRQAPSTLARSVFSLTGRMHRQAPRVSVTLTFLWAGVCVLAVLLSSLPTISLTAALLA